MTLLDYISQIGGLLGLFIGFSVISAVEIIYWLTFRLFRNMSAPKEAIQPHPAFYLTPKGSARSRVVTPMQ